MEELAQSIKANGIIQPIVVRSLGGRYQIVAGERRWRAAQRAGIHRVPVVVKDVSDEKLLELALIENIQRHDLNPVEEARAYRKLIDSIGLTQELVAERVGKSRTMITTSLRLLRLPMEILKMIEEEKITAGHARALLMIGDGAAQRRLAKTIAEMSLSVREAEKAANRINRGDKEKGAEKTSPGRDRPQCPCRRGKASAPPGLERHHYPGPRRERRKDRDRILHDDGSRPDIFADPQEEVIRNAADPAAVVWAIRPHINAGAFK